MHHAWNINSYVNSINILFLHLEGVMVQVNVSLERCQFCGRRTIAVKAVSPWDVRPQLNPPDLELPFLLRSELPSPILDTERKLLENLQTHF